MPPVKLDLKRELARLYSAKADSPTLVDVPPMTYLMVDGEGDPNGSAAYGAAAEALFALAYALKFAIKRRPEGVDVVVMPLEGLWWTTAGVEPALDEVFAGDRGGWRWTAMVAQPPFVTAAMVDEARDALRRRRPLAALDRVRLEQLTEGRAAQVLHCGPHASERPTVEALHHFIAAQGLAMRGRHHEIYLSDPSRTAPERLKTIIRQPVA